MDTPIRSYSPTFCIPGSVTQPTVSAEKRSVGRVVSLEGPAAHLCLVSIVCRSYEKKPDFTGPPWRESWGHVLLMIHGMYDRRHTRTANHREGVSVISVVFRVRGLSLVPGTISLSVYPDRA